MTELIKAMLGILLEGSLFFCMGSLLMRFLGMKENAGTAFVFGLFGCFTLFECIEVPMALLWQSLGRMSGLWAAVMLLTAAACLCLCGRSWGSRLQKTGSTVRDHGWLLYAVIAVVGLQCLIVVLYMDKTVDAAYYVGAVNTAVYTDTLGRYNPYTGLIQNYFEVRYAFSSLPMMNAVWCRLLGLPALIQSKVVMTVLHVLAANLLYYQIGRCLFRGNRKKADLFVMLICLIQLFSYTIYTPGTFFFTRCYEGKAFLANLSVPAIFYAGIWLWQECREKAVWFWLFAVSASALAFSGSSVILPAAAAAVFLPVIVKKRLYGRLWAFAVGISPILLYGCLYVAAAKGYVYLPAS